LIDIIEKQKDNSNRALSLRIACVFAVKIFNRKEHKDFFTKGTRAFIGFMFVTR
jgi:hypothetical protein